MDPDPDLVDDFFIGIEFLFLGEPNVCCVDTPLIAEAFNINTGTGSESRQKKCERFGKLAIATGTRGMAENRFAMP